MIIFKRKLKRKRKELIKEKSENYNRYNPKMSKTKRISWAKKHEGLSANIKLLDELIG